MATAFPPVQRHIFEMPLLGYAGYLPFGVTCALVMDALARLVGAVRYIQPVKVQRTVSPVDGSVYAERPLATGEAGRTVLEKASRPRKPGSRPVAERAAICRRMAEWCVERAEELAAELSWQMGRPVSQSPGELKRSFHERALYMCSIAEEAAGHFHSGKGGLRRFIRREPLGVVLVVAPWNYPWLTSVNAVVPALLAGNSVILKMAAQTPLVAERGRSVQGRRPSRGRVPVPAPRPRAGCARDCGSAFAFVAFTGSVPGGHAVQQAAAKRFIGTASSSAARTRAMCAPTPTSRSRWRTWWTGRSSTPASRAAASSAFMSTGSIQAFRRTVCRASLRSTVSAIRSRERIWDARADRRREQRARAGPPSGTERREAASR